MGVTAGAGADGVRLVNDEKRAEFSREGGGFFPVAGLGMDDADVGEHGLGEDAGDVLVCEFRFERGEIVEFDYAGGFCRDLPAGRYFRGAGPGTPLWSEM